MNLIRFFLQEQGKREEVKDDTGEKKCMPLGVKKKRAGAVKLDQILPGPARRATQCIRKATVIRKVRFYQLYSSRLHLILATPRTCRS